jgi:predicted nucleic acid-binding protein
MKKRKKMSKIITNSTPIIGLSIISKLDLLNALFDTIYVPQAVYNEIVHQGSRKYGKDELKEAVEADKILLYEVKDSQMVNKMYGKLHEGELETIIGAKELELRFVLIDERAARNLAKVFLLRPIGTLGILLLAKKEGKIDKIQPLLDTLLEHDFYISKKLYQQVLKSANEA